MSYQAIFIYLRRHRYFSLVFRKDIDEFFSVRFSLNGGWSLSLNDKTLHPSLSFFLYFFSWWSESDLKWQSKDNFTPHIQCEEWERERENVSAVFTLLYISGHLSDMRMKKNMRAKKKRGWRRAERKKQCAKWEIDNVIRGKRNSPPQSKPEVDDSMGKFF